MKIDVTINVPDSLRRSTESIEAFRARMVAEIQDVMREHLRDLVEG